MQSLGSKRLSRGNSSENPLVSGLDIDPETELTVTCGSTEGMIAAMMATVDPGEEVVVFEPFMRIAPDAILQMRSEVCAAACA